MENNLPRIRIAYLSVNDPSDKRSWSGITYYLGQSLKKNVGDVDFLGPVKFPWIIDKFLRAVAKFTRVVLKKEYADKYSLIRAWYASRQLRKRMKGKQYDCIVAPAASTELSYFNTDIPVVYVSDTTFNLISNYYKREFENIIGFSMWEGNLLEKKSLQKSSLIIYSSYWAQKSAINDYHVHPDKISVMPFGANMDFIPEREIIFEKEKNETLTLLYLAVDWERKGGAIAYEALKCLCARGINAKLIVCGCVPPTEFSHPGMEIIPFLNKNNPVDHKEFVSLLSSVHFLILPTRADCSLLVACESNAYGVPAITTVTGGVPDVVLDGINGYCLNYSANGQAYARLIEEIFVDKKRYHELIYSSRKRFENCLNWNQWTDEFKKLYREKLLPIK